MIKIINGTYGRRVGNRIIPMTSSDDAFELDPDKEERLVNRGVAKYVNKLGDQVELNGVSSKANLNSKEDPNSERRILLLELNRKELDKRARELGVEKPEKFTSKDKVIDAMIELEDDTTDEEIIDDGETPPSFDEKDIIS